MATVSAVRISVYSKSAAAPKTVPAVVHPVSVAPVATKSKKILLTILWVA